LETNPGKPEQRSIEQAFEPEQGVDRLPMYGPQLESDDQHRRVGGRRPIDDRLAVDLRRRAVREVQLKADAPFRQMNPAVSK
jgi:hypothetical protein